MRIDGNFTCSDSELIEYITQNTRVSHNKAYKCLKENCSRKFQGVMRKFGVRDEEDMMNLETDAYVDLFFNVLRGKYKGEAKICTYLISIGRFKWLKLLRDRKIKKTGKGEQGGISIADRLKAYLNGTLDPQEKLALEEELKVDTDLQELLEQLKEPNVFIGDLESVTIPYEEVEEDRSEEMKDYIKQKFPADSHCIDSLITYFFQHDANYYKMAHAIKRSREEIQTVYERVKKQINRCLEKIKR